MVHTLTIVEPIYPMLQNVSKTLICICDPIWETILVVHNSLAEQTLTFKHLLFGHFMQEANEIWCIGGALTGHPVQNS